MVAGAGVIPVAAEDGAIRTQFEAQAPEPTVVGLHKIGRVATDVAGTGGLGSVAVDAITEDVVGEKGIAVFGRETVAEIDQRAGVSMSAARGIGAAGAESGIGPRDPGVVVEMIADGLNIAVSARRRR